MLTQALGKRRNGKAASGDTPFVLEKIRPTGVVTHKMVVLDEDHGVALETVASRQAAGGKTCRNHARA